MVLHTARAGAIVGIALFLSPQERTEEKAVTSPVRVKELGTPVHVRVQVVNERAFPVAGVEVGLDSSEVPFFYQHWIEKTGADGIAEFRDADLRLGPGADHWNGVAGLSIPMVGVISSPIDLGAFSQTPVRLVLPPVGRIILRLESENGQRVADRAEIEFRAMPVKVGTKCERYRPTYHTAITSPSDADIVLPFVGLNMWWMASIRIPGRRMVRVSGPGPVSAGEEVVMQVRVPPTGLRVVGDIVETNGRPLAGHALRIQTQRPPCDAPDQDPLTVTTDVAGRFSVDVTERIGLAHVIRLWFSTESDDGRLLGVRNVQENVPTGVADLGHVMLVPDARLADGIVCDQRGDPVPDARVTLRFTNARHEVEESSIAIWHDEQTISTEADGRFELRGLPLAERCELVAEKPNYELASPVCVDAGAEKTSLTLTSCGSLEGSVAGYDGDDCGPVVLYVKSVRQERGGYASWRRAGCPRYTGQIELGNIPPGLVDVAFVYEPRGGRMELLRIVPDVQIVAGEPRRDFRLEQMNMHEAIERCSNREKKLVVRIVLDERIRAEELPFSLRVVVDSQEVDDKQFPAGSSEYLESGSEIEFSAPRPGHYRATFAATRNERVLSDFTRQHSVDLPDETHVEFDVGETNEAQVVEVKWGPSVLTAVFDALLSHFGGFR